jgi:hypothetical protein
MCYKKDNVLNFVTLYVCPSSNSIIGFSPLFSMAIFLKHYSLL